MRAKQSEIARENTALKAHLKASKIDLNKKDAMIKRLATELRNVS
jgi:hypothetical protein